jgi:hypothetical protein
MWIGIIIGAVALILLTAVVVIIKVAALSKEEQEKMGVSLKGQGR